MKRSTERLLAFLQSSMKEDGVDEGALRSGVRDVLTDVMHICVSEGFDLDGIMASAQEVFEEEAEQCGQFCHADQGDGLTICEEVAGIEHSHHDGEHKCRKAEPEEEAECRRLWAENGVDAVVHLKDDKVVDLSKQ